MFCRFACGMRRAPRQGQESLHNRELMGVYLADLLPDLVAPRLFLEAEGQVEVVPFGPDYQRVLLLLVGRVWLDLALQKQTAVRLSAHQQRHASQPLHVAGRHMTRSPIVPLPIRVQRV